MTLAVTLAATGTAQLTSAKFRPPLKRWTFDDLITAPVVTDIRLSVDRRSIAYVVRSADPARNRMVSTLWIVDTRGAKRRLLESLNIEQLRHIPGTADWSVRADIGAGEQLYRVTNGGVTSLIVRHDPIVRFGSGDQSVHSIVYDASRNVGVLAYDWSPDGKCLWYSVLKPSRATRRVLFDEEVIEDLNVRRPPIEANVEYHLRGPGGDDHIVDARPTSDRLALYFGGNPAWEGDALRFVSEDVDRLGHSRFTSTEVELASGSARILADAPAMPFFAPPIGPLGGRLTTIGLGQSRTLVEDLGGGKQHSYGRIGYVMDDLRAAGSWRSSDGRSAIIGVRTVDHPRYGLVRVDPHGARLVDGPGSFTKCDFSGDLSVGACVREGLAEAPEVVLVDPAVGTTKPVAAVSERHSAITPLKVTPASWTNKLGYLASGFVIWPRGYAAGRRYPAIVINHGSDADERFARQDIQWNYPAQIFAEEGYIVLLINDPAPSQDVRLAAAYNQWASGEGDLKPEEIQCLVWLNSIYTYEAAVGKMVNDGVIDPDRVGIAGFSRGAQMADVAISRSTIFRAASSGDGSYLEPYAYSWMRRSYDQIFGGSSNGPALAEYERLSLSLRARFVSGPVLRQLATPLGGAIDIFRSLRAAGVPVQVTFYPGGSSTTDETHLFHVPLNRLEAMQENLAWFDFWLRGRRSPTMPFPQRYAEWEAMATTWRAKLGGISQLRSSAEASQ